MKIMTLILSPSTYAFALIQSTKYFVVAYCYRLIFLHACMFVGKVSNMAVEFFGWSFGCATMQYGMNFN